MLIIDMLINNQLIVRNELVPILKCYLYFLISFVAVIAKLNLSVLVTVILTVLNIA